MAQISDYIGHSARENVAKALAAARDNESYHALLSLTEERAYERADAVDRGGAGWGGSVAPVQQRTGAARFARYRGRQFADYDGRFGFSRTEGEAGHRAGDGFAAGRRGGRAGAGGKTVRFELTREK